MKKREKKNKADFSGQNCLWPEKLAEFSGLARKFGQFFAPAQLKTELGSFSPLLGLTSFVLFFATCSNCSL
jgi:hypothetical protein